MLMILKKSALNDKTGTPNPKILFAITPGLLSEITSCETPLLSNSVTKRNKDFSAPPTSVDVIMCIINMLINVRNSTWIYKISISII